jgi:hypothetical protein
LQSIPCDSYVGGTEPANDSVYSNYHSSTHNGRDVCFHFPGRENKYAKIRDFNAPAVDRDVSGPEELKFEYIKGRLADASFEEPDQPSQAIDGIFQSIGEAALLRVFQKWMDRLAQCCVAVGD